MKVYELVGLEEVDGDIGVEIEVEGTNLPTKLLKWNSEYDGSLRGESREYVLKKPMSILEVKRALDGLHKTYNKCGSVVFDSARTGVHVHLNVQQLDFTQLFTLICVYLIVEEPLTGFCGASRQGNHFCLRAKDADWQVRRLAEAATSGDLYFLDTGLLRYGALNPTSLFKFGSLEFRAMHCGRDLNPVYKWVRLLHTMKRNSLKFNNPIDVVSKASELGSQGFLDFMFGRYAGHLTGDIGGGVRQAQDVAFARREWL